MRTSQPKFGALRAASRVGLAALLLLAQAAPLARAADNEGRVMEPVPPRRTINGPQPRATPQRPARPTPAAAPPPPPTAAAPAGGAAPLAVNEQGLVNLDFQDVELAVVIDTIAKLTNKNFVYDDRVRGRVTIVSPTPVPVDQAYTVFESVLQVKGFTVVEAPGGVLKVIPIRDAKETSVDTRRTGGSATTPDTDRFVTRLIPLSYIDAEQISNTLKPLVSKEAALVAYQPTNTIILTDSAANIRRILSILEAIDVETFRQELALIRLQYADATIVADQLSDLFGVDVVGGAANRSPNAANRARPRPQPVVPGQPNPTTSPEAAQRGQVRIITDERTNSLVALASRSTLDEIRDFIRRIDVPVEGGGRIQVYYLKHADAEELADTLNSLLGGGGGGGGQGGGPGGVTPQIAGAVTEIANGVGTVTADPATNSLLIQASPEGYQALLRVIEQLDIARPQVLVEALIMEVTVGDGQDLGFNAVVRAVGGDQNLGLSSRTDSASNNVLGNGTSTGSGSGSGSGSDTGSGLGNLASNLIPLFAGPGGFLARFAYRSGNNDVIRAVIKASANNSAVNVLSAPHILTSDNEEAEILVGDNIPIITSRVQSASTTVTDVNTAVPATSVNVERQDIGVTLRVTPQITEGETMRLDIFQEITALNTALQSGVGDPNQVGPALSNRRIENSVVVKDGETVVIGGLISDDYSDTVTKVPWLGNIPVLGWLFKSTSRQLTKRNLLVFLTPRVIRTAEDLEKQSIVKREEFRRHSQESKKQAVDEFEEPIGVTGQTSDQSSRDPARRAVAALSDRYPLERMLEIERAQAADKEKARAAAASQAAQKRYLVLAGVFADPGVAQSTLTRLIDAGYEGTLVSSRASGRVMLELRIGPYQDLEAAERAAEALRLGYALSPQVMVQPSEVANP
jgi:general secretion pathway protein D